MLEVGIQAARSSIRESHLRNRGFTNAHIDLQSPKTPETARHAGSSQDGNLQETFTQSSVPRLSGRVTEIKPLAGSRTNCRKSGSALSFIT